MFFFVFYVGLTTYLRLHKDEFLWGYAMLLSRSFKDLTGAAVLLPVSDLFNHDFEPNVVASIERRSPLIVSVIVVFVFGVLI